VVHAPYRLPVMGPNHGTQLVSVREAEANATAAARRERRRSLLRPLGAVLVVLVVIPTLSGTPAPSLHGTGAWVTVALVAFCAGTLMAMRGDPASRSVATESIFVVLAGAGAVALAGLQPHGSTELAAGAAVFTAVVRLPRRSGLAVAAAITASLVLTMALVGVSSSEAIAATTLLCVLLAVVAEFMFQSATSQDRAEMLYAQLQDARDAQAAAAAIEERGRIAAELHDVLAHSLSGAALQLQGARKLIERHPTEPRIAAAVERAAELVRAGLDDARRAVSALHGENLPGIEQLPALIEGFRQDQHAQVEFLTVGQPRSLGADAGLALYRGAQEALTNIARYAPGATVAVTLRHEPAETTLTIEDHRPGHDGSASDGLSGVGGRHGLSGMRDRMRRVGGQADAGATPDGWRVQLVVPA
jgi:signal transduction histidine kinase